MLCIFVLSSHILLSQSLADSDIKKSETPVRSVLPGILSLTPVLYEYNNNTYSHLKLPKGMHYGFNADELSKVFPRLVHSKPHSFMQGKNRYVSATVKSVDMQGLVPLLVAAIQEQQQQLEDIRRELEGIKQAKP